MYTNVNVAVSVIMQRSVIACDHDMAGSME